MDYEYAIKWEKDRREAAKRGVKLSWTKWLDRFQRDCNHDFRPMIQPMNDAIVGARCRKCGKNY